MDLAQHRGTRKEYLCDRFPFRDGMVQRSNRSNLIKKEWEVS